MATLKTISAVSCGVNYNGTDYKFFGMNSVEISDPLTTSVTRGADIKDPTGLVYRTGGADPIVITATLKMPGDLFQVLNEAQRKGDRMDFYVISDVDGSRTTLSECVLQSPIRQSLIDDTADSLVYTLVFNGYRLLET